MKLSFYEIKLLEKVLKNPEEFRVKITHNNFIRYEWCFADSTEQETFENLIKEFSKVNKN